MDAQDSLKLIQEEKAIRARDKQYQALDRQYRKSQLQVIVGGQQHLPGNGENENAAKSGQ